MLSSDLTLLPLKPRGFFPFTSVRAELRKKQKSFENSVKLSIPCSFLEGLSFLQCLFVLSFCVVSPLCLVCPFVCLYSIKSGEFWHWLMLRRYYSNKTNNHKNKCLWSGMLPMIWESYYNLLFILRAAFISKCLLTCRKTKIEVSQALLGKPPAESPVATSPERNGMSWIDVEQIDLVCGWLGKQQEILQLCKAKSSSTSLCFRLMAMPDCTWKEFALPTGADQWELSGKAACYF